MLDQSIKDQLTTIFRGLKSNYAFRITVHPDHPNRQELIALLQDVAACSSKLSTEITDGDGLSFVILRDGQPSSFVFRAIPNGHEFTTLLLAILNLDGSGKNLPDEAITARIRALRTPLLIQSYISLTCTNCPDVVQALNVCSILNPEIRHEIIDGAIHKEEVEKLGIQAVPTVYANGELLHVGRSDLGELLDKLADKAGTSSSGASEEIRKYDVIVAGGGPAGVTSAIYSSRKGLKVALVAANIGGQVNETLAIDNMISVPRTTGQQLAGQLRGHLKEYPVDIFENRRIEKAESVEGMKRLCTSMGEVFEAPALIIATGASWRRLNVPGESQYMGAGVAFCAHCDGPFYKGKRVAVIGGGNSGLEAAIDLAGITTHVTVLEFLEELKGDQVLRDKLAHLPNVEFLTGAETLSIDGDGAKVTSLAWKNRKTGETARLELDGVFVQIGLKPNSQVFEGLVAMNRFGEIITDAHCRTNIPGIYAAGDVSTVPYKQIVIAMGEGSKAALSAFEDKIKDLLTIC